MLFDFLFKMRRTSAHAIPIDADLHAQSRCALPDVEPERRLVIHQFGQPEASYWGPDRPERPAAAAAWEDAHPTPMLSSAYPYAKPTAADLKVADLDPIVMELIRVTERGEAKEMLEQLVDVAKLGFLSGDLERWTTTAALQLRAGWPDHPDANTRHDAAVISLKEIQKDEILSPVGMMSWDTIVHRVLAAADSVDPLRGGRRH
jgi:hypothetical protein